MTPEQLDEIEKRWAGYLEKNEVERRFLFDRWWDKRDFWDMTKALREAWEALDEGEGDMHARIRAGYDKTVADSWRAHCAKIEKERDDARAEVERLRSTLRLVWEEATDEERCHITNSHMISQPCRDAVAAALKEDE